jgi:hypothetical protein
VRCRQDHERLHVIICLSNKPAAYALHEGDEALINLLEAVEKIRLRKPNLSEWKVQSLRIAGKVYGEQLLC